MKTESYIHSYFHSLSPFVSDLANSFSQIGKVMEKGRNEVRVIELENYKVVVKSYERINWINRLIYGFFRKSKACRAFENASLLMDKGITTPMPVAYVDYFNFGILKKSYFVSLYVNCRSTNKLFALPINECKEALEAFSRFTYQLHRSGIFHADYTLNNVLYSKVNEEYIFCLVDNNRMRYQKYTQKRALRNLRRIKLPLDKYAVVAMEYARQEQSDAFQTAQKMLFYRQADNIFSSLKKNLKNILNVRYQ